MPIHRIARRLAKLSWLPLLSHPKAPAQSLPSTDESALCPMSGGRSFRPTSASLSDRSLSVVSHERPKLMS